jgi:quercetin dioxygenase-like cupin family protein
VFLAFTDVISSFTTLTTQLNTTMTSEKPPNTNRTIHRFITTHDASGKAIISKEIASEAPIRDVMGGDMSFSLMYTNPSMPPELNQDADIKTYKGYLETPPAITIPGGSVCRVCNYPPGYTTPMHRTQSLDFGVVLEGEIELVLDSGETQRLGRGDTVVQRGTNHAWRNVGEGWARMFYLLEHALPVEVGGRVLGEDEGGID